MISLLEKGGKFPSSKRVLFLGDSITDNGTYIAHIYSYFIQHLPDFEIELINLGVSSETVSGLSEPDHPFPRPCVLDRVDNALKLANPDYVVVCYGMNDAIYYPFSEARFSAYKKGVSTIINKIKTKGAKVILLTPPPFDSNSVKSDNQLLPEGMEKYSFMNPYIDYTNVLKQYGEWILSNENQLADKVIDIYTPLTNFINKQRELTSNYIYGDGIHPNVEGHWVIAQTLLSEIFNICLEQTPQYLKNHESSKFFQLIMERHRLLSSAWKEYVGHTNPNKVEALPINEAQKLASEFNSKIHDIIQTENLSYDSISIWKGYTRHDFYFQGKEAILIEPKAPLKGNPWIWRTEFFDAFSSADMALVENGWHLAYLRISNQYGCKESINTMSEFHNELINKFQLSTKPTLFGFSRGGLYAINYALENPQNVSCLYLDAPVLHICSWPAGYGEGIGSLECWNECKAVYGLDEITLETNYISPLQRINILAEHKIPVIVVAGDSDEVVPFSENGDKLVTELKVLGGDVKLILKSGVGHHPHSLKNPGEIVEFVKQRTI